MAKKTYKMNINEFKQLVRTITLQMLREQDEEFDFGAAEVGGDEEIVTDDSVDMDMGGEDDFGMDMDIEGDEGEGAEIPEMSDESDVAEVLDDVATVVAAAAEVLADLTDAGVGVEGDGEGAVEVDDEVVGEMMEAAKHVTRARRLHAQNSRKASARQTLARLRKLNRK